MKRKDQDAHKGINGWTTSKMSTIQSGWEHHERDDSLQSIFCRETAQDDDNEKKGHFKISKEGKMSGNEDRRRSRGIMNSPTLQYHQSVEQIENIKGQGSWRKITTNCSYGT